jgi:flagellar motor switch protein FliM
MNDDLEITMNVSKTRKTEVLSQDEIDQLLTAINAGDNEEEDFKSASSVEFKPVRNKELIDIYQKLEDLEVAYSRFHKKLQDMVME